MLKGGSEAHHNAFLEKFLVNGGLPERGEMVDPVISFIISVIILIGMLVKKVEVHIAVMIATIAFGVLALGVKIFESTFEGILTYSTARLLIAFISALFLSYMMKVSGILEKMTRLFASLSCNFASLFIPSLVGLIPMPGGALVSAMMLKEHYLDKQELGSNFASFLNYWFRHIWVPVWPLYQALILTAVILDTSIVRVIEATFPAAIATILAGLLISIPLLRKRARKCEIRCVNRWKLALASWPFILIIVLVFGVRLPVEFALLITALIVTLYTRPSKEQIKEGLKFALSIKILVIVVAVMMYRQYVYDSRSADALLHFMTERGIPIMPVTFILPFVIGATTAGEFVYAGTAFPLLINVLGTGSSINNLALLLGYTGGYMGVMISPVHLCLILTIEHYRASFKGTYRYIIPAAIISAIISVVLGVVLWL